MGKWNYFSSGQMHFGGQWVTPYGKDVFMIVSTDVTKS
jgi:hypothetical protein